MGVALPAAGFAATRLEAVFDRCFASSENTRLVGGAAEPLYQPGRAAEAHQLYYREDFFASALHEISHWCIAGAQRRQLLDFGYWYAPEGRNTDQQQAFEAVEVKPQALEWIFSQACGYRFRLSVDNFAADGSAPDCSAFAAAVVEQAHRWQQAGLPPRAGQFFHALVEEFHTPVSLPSLQFDLRALL